MMRVSPTALYSICVTFQVLYIIHASSQTPVVRVVKADYLRDYAGCISHHEAKELLALRTQHMNTEISYSIDLNRSKVGLHLSPEGICTQQSNLIATWDELQSIAKKTTCFALYGDGSKPWQINVLSSNTGMFSSFSSVSFR